MRTSMLRGLGLAVLCAGLTCLAPLQAADDEGFRPIFNGKDLKGWKTFLQGGADPAKTFSVKDGVLVCTGKPNGYFYTEKSLKNYVLRFDWMYPVPKDPKARPNSGLLVHIQDKEPRTWPKCVEVQGAEADHGKTFAIGNTKDDANPAKFTGKYDKAAKDKAVKPAGEWNTTEVTCAGGRISVKLNGVPIDSGEGNLTEGPIGFQSEGSEIHFRNLKVKDLK